MLKSMENFLKQIKKPLKPLPIRFKRLFALPLSF
ncbi:hypothetical protein CLOLEP_00538 [[Clostridium] leptum DSM 753]|uniref:Uncharacterized protein n=1 Tax=[Clostridium] leptum DSM 753 TaxID=428125 RepID=A7VPR0_9FIRM|nr:hypothetical protein CLOLEP_00538 [[Clostridium] leptum DSM 753]